MEALTKNTTIKIFDYSMNKLGESKNLMSGAISECFRQNKTLIHVDFSLNFFKEEESAIIADGLTANKNIYGIHFRGNYGYINSKGFLILKEK